MGVQGGAQALRHQPSHRLSERRPACFWRHADSIMNCEHPEQRMVFWGDGRVPIFLIVMFAFGATLVWATDKNVGAGSLVALGSHKMDSLLLYVTVGFVRLSAPLQCIRITPR